jgi:hypothetical protein
MYVDFYKSFVVICYLWTAYEINSEELRMELIQPAIPLHRTSILHTVSFMSNLCDTIL